MTGKQAATTSRLTSSELHMPPQASVPIDRLTLLSTQRPLAVRTDSQVISLAEMRPM